MKLISHRGNINGRQPGLENMPEYIDSAIELGYDVEVDVWYKDGFWLGHDNPKYKIEADYLANDKLWCHAKNLEALVKMKKYSNIHYFWHQNDDYTLTSEGFIWTFPKKSLYCDSICVLPELGHDKNINNCYGICSDYIENYKK
tara:strand:+ start:386 stop:817 length:432 start_codon:yes stop_codon:yes gene_type:complete